MFWASLQPSREGMPGTPSNFIFTCQIGAVFYFTELEAVSQNTCYRGGLPDLSRIGQFHRTFQSGNRLVLLMKRVHENRLPKEELWVSILDVPALRSFLFTLTGRHRKIILLLRKENAFSHFHPTRIQNSKMKTRETNKPTFGKGRGSSRTGKILLQTNFYFCTLLCINCVWVRLDCSI